MFLFFFFLVTFSNDLLIPVPSQRSQRRTCKPGVPTTEAYEAILNVPNDADKAINILSK